MKNEMFQPVGSRILVLPDPKGKETEGGIVLPDTHKDKTKYGTVVAVGTGVYYEQAMISFGSIGIAVDVRIAYKPKAQSIEVIKLNGVEHIVLDASDILGHVSNE